MKMRLLMLLAATASLQAGPFKGAAIDRAKLEEAIQEAAGKVEEKYGGQNAGARDLQERVQGILQRPVREEAEPQGAAKLAHKMSLLTYHFAIQPGLGGHSGIQTDRSKQAQAANYQRLESLKAEGQEEVVRWLQMAEAAGAMKDEAKENRCRDTAVGMAHALVSREPDNAQAHALLADILDWRKGLEGETLQSLQKVLKLDSKNLLARFLMYNRRIKQTAEETFSRKPARLEDPLGSEFSHLEKSRANPVSDEEMAALAKRSQGLLQESEALMKEAVSTGDFVVFCRLWECQTDLLRMATIAKLPKQMPPDATLENLQGAYLQLGVMKAMAQVLCQPAETAFALKLAGDDAQRTGAVAICCSMGLFFKAGLTRQIPGPDDLKGVQAALLCLEDLSRQSNGLAAARF